MYKTHAINELSFPKTAHEIQARRTPDHIVYGGAARSALLESQSTPLIPIRDIDEIPINQVDGQSFFTKIGDFSIDQALVLGNGELTLYITDQAQEAAAQRCIEPTDDRINAARKLEELHKAKPEDIRPLQTLSQSSHQSRSTSTLSCGHRPGVRRRDECQYEEPSSTSAIVRSSSVLPWPPDTEVTLYRRKSTWTIQHNCNVTYARQAR